MLKPKPLFIALILMGLAGGAVRALELRYVYDAALGLPKPWHPITLALIALTAVAAAASFLLALKNNFNADTRGGGFAGARLSLVLAALILACASIADVAGSDDWTLSRLVLSGLGLLAALLLVLMTKNTYAKMTNGMFSTVTVFWASFWFLLMFANNAGNPVIGTFWYEFMGVLFSLLSFYFFSGFHFNRPRPRLLAFALGMGVYFTLVSIVGVGAAWILFPAEALLDGVTLPDVLRLLFALTYILSIPSLTSRVRTLPGDPTKEDDEDSESDDD
jgi:hypothetical protein